MNGAGGKTKFEKLKDEGMKVKMESLDDQMRVANAKRKPSEDPVKAEASSVSKAPRAS